MIQSGPIDPLDYYIATDLLGLWMQLGCWMCHVPYFSQDVCPVSEMMDFCKDLEVPKNVPEFLTENSKEKRFW